MMNTIALEGRVAVVTGGASGMGLATARRLAQSGAKVAIWDLSGPSMEAARREFGRSACMEVDVTDPAAAESAAAVIAKDHNRLDILAHCAGIVGDYGPTDTFPVDEWNRILTVNLFGSFYCCRAVLPHMKANRYGRIVMISSAGAKDGHPFMAAYVTSKGGVLTFTKSLGKEVARDGILVNCITPGVVNTPMMQASGMDKESRDKLSDSIPIGRIAQPEEIASMVAWLSSDECSYTSGAVFDASGGRTNY